MKTLRRKYFNHQFAQNLLTELIGNLLMLIAGLVIGYYIRIILF